MEKNRTLKPMKCGKFALRFETPAVMGILNVTPDSFFDGGKFAGVEAAVVQAKKMAAEGAGIIDVGGESSRPGAQPVPGQEEIVRVVPVIERLAQELDVPVSVDTHNPAVARKALEAGACIINDITALAEPGMAELASEFDVPVVLMHMKGNPKTMQEKPEYPNVVKEVKEFLEERIAFAEKNGVAKTIVDPGIGFGKTVEHNLELIANIDEFQSLGVPVLAGLSRKSFIGKVLGAEAEDRLAGTIAANCIALWNNADILRVHDVKEAVESVKLVEALKRQRNCV